MPFCGSCGTSLSGRTAFCTNCGTPVGETLELVQRGTPPPEQCLFDESGIFISPSRFVTPSQTYAMSGVTSVRTVIARQSRVGPFLTALLGLFFVIEGIIHLQQGSTPAVLGATLVGAILAAIGVLIFVRRVPSYSVMLHSASGEVEATSRKDKDLIQRVMAAVNQAIVLRG